MAVLQFVVNKAVWEKLGPQGQAALEAWYYASSKELMRQTDIEDRKLVAAEKAGTGTKNIEVIDDSTEERAKFRKLAQGAWKDISKRSPLAKEAYGAHIKFLNMMGLLEASAQQLRINIGQPKR